MTALDHATASDDDLVAAWVTGDRAAFDVLVGRYERRVYGICYRYFGNPTDAEDAAQEAFVALLRRAATFSGASSFSTWMYRVTTNACNDLARNRARRPQAADTAVADLAGTAELDDVIANHELGLELSRALAQLDAGHRDAVLLHDVVGLPYADVADRLGLPVGTVKSRVHRGHARLAGLLGHLAPPAGVGGPHPPNPPREPSAATDPPTT
jgi:RNA polymerase sigma-70 factor, ECF subfamily